MVAFLLTLAACASEESPPDAHETLACTSFRNEDDLPSSTQTFGVAVDAERGRAVATGLGLPWLSVVDLAAGVRTDALRYALTSTQTPHVALDGAGVAWVASASAPSLVRLDLDTRSAQRFGDLDPQRWVVGLDAGVLVQDGGRAARLDGAGAVAATASVEAARGAARHPDGVVVLGEGRAFILDADTLAELASCALPFSASDVAALPDGTLVVSDLERIARVTCAPDGPSETWTVGLEIHALVAHGDAVWAVDRIGPADPTRGVLWSLGATGEPVAARVTAKNTASGGFAADGTFWGNAEGSSEVVGWRPDGSVVAEVSTGTSVADLVVAEGGVVYGTGRLSALVGRLDGDALLRAEPLVWPWAPRLDGDRLVLLDHLQGELATLDATTLGVRSRLDLGVGPNPLLTFDSLAPAPDRGTWLVAESAADALLEVDLDAGTVLRRWPLGGPAVDEPDLGAQLELQYLGAGVAFFARTTDGRLSRLDLASGEVQTAWLDAGDLDVLRDRRLTRATLVDGDSVWLGPLRIDPVTLTVAERWPDIEGLQAPWPDAPGEWAAITADGLALVHVDAAGALGARFEWFAEPEPGTVIVPAPEGDAAWVNRSYEGLACRVPWAVLDAGRDAPPTP